MTRAAAAPAPAPFAAVGERVWLAVAVLAPLVLVAGGSAPDLATALLVCAVAAVLAVGSCSVSTTLGSGASGWRGAATAPPYTASRNPDPVHHPVSPRAPGLV